jgi:hypothetical protein
MGPYVNLLEQAESVVALLRGEEQSHGRRLWELCSAALSRPRQDGKLVVLADDLGLRRELGHLVELLSRRSSTAIGLATLGRAALAELAGDLNSAVATRREFETKLALLGL